jgi:diaminopimelate epimerase
MRKLDFVKAQGIGNDFIMVDARSAQLDLARLPDLAVRLCNRNYGIGGDGLILIHPSTSADYRMQIINSDGSEAEMCGNGIRCFAAYLRQRESVAQTVSIETLAGVKTVEIQEYGGSVSFTVNMGAPALDARDIPINGFEGRVISQTLDVDGTTYRVTCVSMGNPHCVIFTDSVSNVPLAQVGPKIENHPAFPRKTNVEFVQVTSPEEITFRVWERGAGVTLACGTGACAAVVAGVLNDKLARKVKVHLPGGDLVIDWREDGNVYMTGPAEEVFTGTIGI